MKHIKIFEHWIQSNSKFEKKLVEDAAVLGSQRVRKDGSYYAEHGGKPPVPNLDAPNLTVQEKFEDLVTYCQVAYTHNIGVKDAIAKQIYDQLNSFNTDEALIINLLKTKSGTKQGFSDIINSVDDMVRDNVNSHNFEDGIKNSFDDNEIQQLFNIYKSLK